METKRLKKYRIDIAKRLGRKIPRKRRPRGAITDVKTKKRLSRGVVNEGMRKVTRYLADTDTVTPVEVMLAAMREALLAKDLALAHSYAKDAAPYIHPKLGSIAYVGEVEHTLKIQHLKDWATSDLDARIRQLEEAEAQRRGRAEALEGGEDPEAGSELLRE